MTNPTIAVIVANYNHAALLPRCLDSIATQTRPADEVVVVDDGSTDDSLAVLAQALPAGSRVVRQSNQGVSAARNAGVEAAGSDYVLFLDADDALAPNALQYLAALLDVHQQPDVVHGDWDFINDRSRRSLRQSGSLGDLPLETLVRRNPMALHSVLVRRSLLPALGGFRDRGSTVEDWELWLRMAAGGASFHHVARVVAHYHWRPGSGSSQFGRVHAARLAILAEQRPLLASHVPAALWPEAEVNAWLDHAANLWRADDLPAAASALGQAERIRPGLLSQVDTWYRLWRADYLEALGDRDAAERERRWEQRRGRMTTLLPLLRGTGPSLGALRSACAWALAQALREDGRPRTALGALGRALLEQPALLGQGRLLRLASRCVLEGLPKRVRECL